MRESSATRRKRKDTSSGEHPQPEFCNEVIQFGSRTLYCGRQKGHEMERDAHQSAVLVSWGRKTS